MVTSAADISIVLSGGSTNADPNESLGGPPSNTPITTAITNNLFNDVSSEDQEGGHEDYRCFYLFNDGDTPIYTVRVWITEEESLGASVEMGIRQQTELQRLSITPVPTTGQMTLSFEGIEIVSTYDSDLGVWAANLQNQLNSITKDGIPLLREVLVTAQQLSGQLIFDFDFGGGLGGVGHDDKKDHDLISYESDNFDNEAEGTMSVLQEGKPINSIADAIDSDEAVPIGVGFFKPSEQSPLEIVRLLPTEGLPIWVKRVVAADSDPVEKDGFTFRVRANSLDPYA